MNEEVTDIPLEGSDFEATGEIADNSARQELLSAFGEADEEIGVNDMEELVARIQQDTGLPREEVERRLSLGAE